MTPKWIREGTAIYALNANGHNEFVVTVGRGCMCDKCGPYDDDKRAEHLALAKQLANTPEIVALLKRVVFGSNTTDDARSLLGEIRAILHHINKETP